MSDKGQTGRSDRTIVRRMGSGDRERWRELCEQVAREQDPAKVLALCEEINRLLQENEERLGGHKPASAA